MATKKRNTNTTEDGKKKATVRHNKVLMYNTRPDKQANAAVMSKVILEHGLAVVELHSVGTAIDNGNRYCSCGFLDCPKPGKHPATWYSWKLNGRATPEKLNWLFSNNKRNVAVITGRCSTKTGKHLIVVDVDSHNHPFLNRLFECNTFHYRTGGGGYHFWFWIPKELSKNTTSVLADLLDTKGKDGYVIIPTSEHVRGYYKDIVPNDIQDTPGWLVDDLQAKARARSSNRSSATGEAPIKNQGCFRKQRTKQLANVETLIEQSKLLDKEFWINSSVAQIKEAMGKGEMVPVGVRNGTMFRLLAAHRATGADVDGLFKYAMTIINRFENHQEFANEVKDIASSVMKYKGYGTNYKNVNQNYVNWLKKNTQHSFDMETPEERLAALEQADKEFFDGLEEAGDEDPGLSLVELTNIRDKYLKKKLYTNGSVYRPQLLARKLVALGFKRIRTAKRNYWNIRVKADILDSISVVEHYQWEGLGVTTISSLKKQYTLSDSTENKSDLVVEVKKDMETKKDSVVALHFSDIHSDLNLLRRAVSELESKGEGFDCWINTGDFFPNLPHGGLVVAEQAYQRGWFGMVKKELFEILQGKPVVTVDGNHDFVSLGGLLKEHGYPGLVFEVKLGETVEFNGLRFRGFPHIPWCGGCWNHELGQTEMERVVRQTFDCEPNSVDVLLTHAPPAGILSGPWGIPSLTAKLQYVTHGFRYHLFGHVHEKPGKHSEQYIEFYNSARCVQRVVLVK